MVNESLVARASRFVRGGAAAAHRESGVCRLDPVPLDALEPGLRELVGWDAAGSPFTVAEQIVDGDARRAVLGLEGLFRSGFAKRDGGRELDRGALVAMLGSTVPRSSPSVSE